MKDERIKEELKPCPFCGGEAEYGVGENGDGTPWDFIECVDCGATTEPEIWNTRAAERLAKIEALDELKRDIQKEFPHYDRFLQGRGHENEIICGTIEKRIAELKATASDAGGDNVENRQS